MADELIIDGDIIDLSEIPRKVDLVIEQINRIDFAIQEVNKKGLKLNNVSGMKELREATDQLIKATQTLTTAINDAGKARQSANNSELIAAKVATEEAKAKREQAKADGERTKSLIAQERELERLIALEEKQKNKTSGTNDVPFEHNLNALEQERIALQDNIEVVSDADRAQAEAAISANEWASSLGGIEEEVGKVDDGVPELIGSIDEFTGSLRQNILAHMENKKSIADNRAQQAEIQKAMKATGITTDAQRNKLAQLKEQELLLVQANKSLSTTINNQIKEFNAAGGSIDEMRAKVNNLQRNYEALSIQERSTPFGKGLKSQIDVLEPELLKMEKSLGKSQRNVGNYASSVFSSLRNLAYLIPGIGLAGLIGIITDKIGDLFTALFKGKDALDQFKAAKQTLDKAMTSQEYITASANLNELRINIGLAKDGLLDKKEVLEQYNDTLGKTTGSVNSLDEAEAAIVKNGPAYLQMLLLQAAAHLALQEAAKKAVDAEVEFQNSLKVAKDINKEGEAKKDVETGAAGLSEFLARGVENEAKAAKKSADKRVTTLQTIANDFQTQAAEIAKKFNFDFFGGDGKGGKTDNSFEQRIKKQFDALERDRKAKFELSKLEVQDEINKQKAIAAAALPYVSAQAREQQFTEEKRLIDLETQYELRANDLKIASIAAVRDEKLKNTKLKPQERDNIIANANAEIEAARLTATEREIIVKKANDRIIDAELRATNDVINIRQGILNADKALGDAQIKEFERQAAEEIKARIDNLQKFTLVEQNYIERGANERLAALNNEYRSGHISKQKYEDEKRKIENDALRKSLQAQITFYTALLDLYEFDADKKAEALNKIAEIQKRLSGIGLEDDTAGLQKRIAALKSLGEELKGTVFDLLEGGITKQKNEIQEQIDLIEKRKQKEIEAANQSIVSTQDRAAAISIIEKRAAAQKEALERRQRELDIQKARFDRARTVANIIQNTAEGITAALASKPPNPILAGIVAAIGAIQLVRALAVPIPRFFKGKNVESYDNSYEGYGIVDDGPDGKGGHPEAVIRAATGDVEIGGNKPRVTWLDRNDIVLPDARQAALRATASVAHMVVVKNENTGMGELRSDLKYGFKTLNNTIKNKEPLIVRPYSKVDIFVRGSKRWEDL